MCSLSLQSDFDSPPNTFKVHETQVPYTSLHYLFVGCFNSFQSFSVAPENIPNRITAKALAISGSLGTTKEWQKDAVLQPMGSDGIRWDRVQCPNVSQCVPMCPNVSRTTLRRQCGTTVLQKRVFFFCHSHNSLET